MRRLRFRRFRCVLFFTRKPSLCGGWVVAIPSIPHRDGHFETSPAIPPENRDQFTLV